MAFPTLSTLVLATDGSADAAVARRAVTDIARATGATVHVVSAWNLTTAEYGFPATTIPYDVPTPYEESARTAADTDRRAIEDAGIRATQHVVCDRPSDAILGVADSMDAGLVVVGGRGHGAIGRLLLGSVSDAVVRQAARPVLVVRGGGEAWPPERVLAGHDGSEEAIAAVRLAALVASAVGAPLTVLEIVPSRDERFAGGPRLSLGDLIEGRRGELEQHLEDRGVLPQTGSEVRVEPGDPAATLLAAASCRSTMVAVGRRGIGRVREAFLGSVSTKLLHATPGAVLVVPRHGA